MQRRNYSTGRGIAKGLENATGNVLKFMQAREKIEAEKERTKVLNSYTNAQIKLAEYKLKEAESAVAGDEMFMKMMQGGMFGGGGQQGGQQGGGQQGGGIPMDRIMPSGYKKPTISRTIGGNRYTLAPEEGLTAKQRLDEQRRQQDEISDTRDVLSTINNIKKQVLNKGTFKTGGEEVEYKPGIIPKAISNKFPNANMNDPKVREALFPLENKRGDVKPFSGGTKGLVNRGLSGGIKNRIQQLSRETREYIGGVTSQKDIDVLVGDREKAEAQGIDVDAVLAYYGRE